MNEDWNLVYCLCCYDSHISPKQNEKKYNSKIYTHEELESLNGKCSNCGSTEYNLLIIPKWNRKLKYMKKYQRLINKSKKRINN
ncbi:MAG TPA: hypothetical protein VMZ91_13825 [Candidatus Paceibacterota bacterium]|nr:hypothetical protein [Candidatus Paceibacterota bacterium]